MRRLIARFPSPAMGVAFVALLAALSGTAVALPGTGSVDSGDLKNNAVRSNDIRNNNVSTRDLRDGTVTGNDTRDDSLTGLDIDESTLGQVPSANTANTANTANSANSANTASSVGANGVNTAAIQDNAVTGEKIADTTVGTADIGPEAVTGPKIATDAVGASELKGIYAAVSGGTPAAANTFVGATATCNPGDAVLGGGYAWQDDADEIETVHSTPDPLINPNKWVVRSRTGAANTLFAWAVCLAS
jgi:hypothetical protein